MIFMCQQYLKYLKYEKSMPGYPMFSHFKDLPAIHPYHHQVR